MRQYTFLFLILLFPFLSRGQQQITLSGLVKDSADKSSLPFVTLRLLSEKDSTLITGTITNEEGRFSIGGLKPGSYRLALDYLGYRSSLLPVLVGSLSDYLDLGIIELQTDGKSLEGVEVSARPDEVSSKMDKKTFDLSNNLSQAGGSVLQAMKNLPGITVDQDGKVQLRGNDKVMVLVDGKQTALTGFDGQASLDNIPASAIEKIEIINNPSSKYDANGHAGIINIVYKKNRQEGLSGKATLAGGLGALWIKRQNLPGMRPQYQATPKINPSLSLNYRRKKINLFLQGDYLYTHTLNKNEFVQRVYDNGLIVNQQTKRNRNTSVAIAKAGMDWNKDEQNTFSFSALFSSEHILDNGDEPFFNSDYTVRNRLWQFLEDELKTTVTATANFRHQYKAPGRFLNVALNYTFHRENERYFFTNTLPTFIGQDAFRLLSDENVADLNIDYVRPTKHGRFETGLKFRQRYIPTNMQFYPGLHSPLDTTAGGWANYSETIPALYGNYILENKNFELEAGLRVEYVNVYYQVNPQHPVYRSNGYNYFQPFPNLRLAYKLPKQQSLSLFYNRRIDRPAEGDIRIFPKYDDAEILKVGNPGLKPQYSNALELGYKAGFKKGYFYSALYHRRSEGTITRIATTLPGNTLIYNVMQNAGRSYTSGIEIIFSQDPWKWLSYNITMNAYNAVIEGFSVENKYPQTQWFTAARQQTNSGNAKLNLMFHLSRQLEAQLTALYLAPDIVPQGKTNARYSVDMGLRKGIQKGKGELFLNATDIFNTLVIRMEVQSNGFRYTSANYYETQVFRVGYAYKF